MGIGLLTLETMKKILSQKHTWKYIEIKLAPKNFQKKFFNKKKFWKTMFDTKKFQKTIKSAKKGEVGKKRTTVDPLCFFWTLSEGRQYCRFGQLRSFFDF